MILESAILNVKSGQSTDFETAFAGASPLIASMPGYVRHELQRCLETPDRFLLLVWWETLEPTPSAFAGRRNTRSGAPGCTTFTTRFQQWNTSSRHTQRREF